MLLKRVTVRNFRNLDDVTVTFEPFNVIIGSNNSGKTNLLEAIRKVLGPGSSRNVAVLNSDFGDLTKPIEIEVCFHLTTEHDLAAFYGTRGGQIDPAKRTVTIKFTAEWRQESREIYTDCFILRDGLPDDYRQQSAFDWTFKRYILFEHVPAIREVRSGADFSMRSSDLRQIFTYYASDFLRPIEALFKVILHQFNSLSDTDLLDQLGLTDVVEDLRGEFRELQSAFYATSSTDGLVLSRDQINALRDSLEGIAVRANAAMGNSAEDKTDQENIYVQIVRDVIEKTRLLITRAELQLTLFDIREGISHTSQFTTLEAEIADTASALLPINKASLRLFPIKDNELIASAAVDMDGKPLQDQGSGTQSSFIIGLKLLRALAQLQDSTEVEANYLLLALEEIEAHLHPQMQRFIVKALKSLQKRFADLGKTIQITLTTHSPSILSGCEIGELKILRPEGQTPRVGQCTDADLEQVAREIAGDNIRNLSKRINTAKTEAEKLLLTNGDALFAKCVIVAEGESEQGAFPVFAQNMLGGFDIDECGISVINGKGSNMRYLLHLLRQLNIPFTFAYDSSDKNHEDLGHVFGGYETREKAFEHEVMATIPWDLLVEAVYETHEHLVSEMTRTQPKTAFFEDIDSPEKLIGKLRTEQVGEIEKNEIHKLVASMLKNAKSSVTGRRIAQKTTCPDYIPTVYREMLLDARRKALGERDADRNS